MNKALACIYGALVGDAYGAQLEFLKPRPIPQDLMDLADEMDLDGLLGIPPGQLTDDGELTICLLRALVSNHSASELYHAWFISDPVDCGLTCKNAFCVATANEQIEESSKYNYESQANGALMRATPIGVIGARAGHPIATIADAARDDARLSHPNIVCQEANAAYAVAIAHLIKTNNRTEAISVALAHCRDETVRSWITCEDAEDVVRKSMNRDNIGWVKWGVLLAFHHLKHETSYEVAIRETCRLGGDTDTNACIVGGLVGAACNVEDIPSWWLTKVLTCIERPEWLRPSCVVELLREQHYTK
jgi:ADP-ribosylglycohydrolase